MGQRSTGKAGIGVVLEMLSTSLPAVFEAISNVSGLEAGGVSLTTIDATHLNSPNFYKEFVPGMKTSQAWTGTLQFDPDEPTHGEATGLRQRLEARRLTTLRVNFVGIGVLKGIEVTGYVTELGNVSISAEAIMTQNFSFQPRGKVQVVTIDPFAPPLPSLNFSRRRNSGYVGIL